MKMPTNLAFWRWTLAKEKDVNSFLERGTEQQLKNMLHALQYFKRMEDEYFEQINGKEIIKKLKRLQ